jgi:hypothetical protein
MDELTLALVLTAGGAVASSALITGLIQLLKALPGVGGALDAGREKLAAFALSAALVVAAFLVGANEGTVEVNGATIFGAFLAWYGIARLSMGIYDDATAQPNSLTGPEA